MPKRSKKRVTLEDIAREAGVSAMTVSRVLNNKGEISETTRQRVMKIIEAMDYRPSRIARSLATNRTATIGITVPDIANPYFAEFVSGAQTVAWDNDYNLVLCNTQENADREREVLRLLEENRVDGVIVCGTRLPSEELIKLLKVHRATVLVNRELAVDRLGIVRIDEVTGTTKAVSHLMKSRRTLGMITGPAESQSARLRRETYQHLQQKQGYVENCQRIVASVPDAAGGYDAAIGLLTDHPTIDGLFCYNDPVAAGAIRACRELGKSVPEDIAVIGYDDTAFAQYVHPPLTTVRTNAKQMGIASMEMLLQSIDGKPEKTSVIMEPELIIRESAP